MKLYKPDYYDKFSCIADKCDFTCCQDWTIAVDDETLAKWKNMKLPTCMECKNGRKVLSDYVVRENSPAIDMQDGICPFLNDRKLCNIVLEYGEDNISETCHTFPREKREYEDRLEEALSLSCKTAAELLFSCEEFNVITHECDETAGAEKVPDYIYATREWFVEISKDNDLSVPRIIKVVFYLARDMADKKISDFEAFRKYRESGIADEVKKALSEEKPEEYYVDMFLKDDELLLDLLSEYYKEKKYLDKIKDIYEEAELIEEEEGIGETIESYRDYLLKVRTQFDKEVRLIVSEELWASLLTGEADFDAMTVKIEWLAIEIAVLRQWLFIMYRNKGVILRDDFIETVAVLFRITGYCDDDITEYMQNSFENIIWDFGYLDLIL